MLTVIVAGRNDDYGKDFRERLFRTALHNSSLLRAAEIDFEYMLAEWNPLPDRPPLSRILLRLVPCSVDRSVVDHDDLVVGERLDRKCIQRRPQQSPATTYRDDDRDSRDLACRSTRSHRGGERGLFTHQQLPLSG